VSSIARYVSHEALPSDRGRGFGKAQRDAVHGTVSLYKRIFAEDLGLDEPAVREHGRQVEAVIRSYRPALCDELEGIAAGANVSAEWLYAINARTELLSGGKLSGGIGGECSTIAILDDARSCGLLAQTWDFHPAVRRQRVWWTRQFPDGTSFTTLTEAGQLAKIGVNSHGLALSMNWLSTDRDSADGGVPIHILARTVLEEARTVDDAHQLAEDAPACGSGSLTVAGLTRAGGVDAVSLERWPGGVGALAASPETRTLIRTNHFLTPIGARDSMLEGRGSNSTELRYAFLRRAVENGVAPEVSAVCDLLSSESSDKDESIVQHEDDSRPWLERCVTLATFVFEVPAGTVWFRGETDPTLPLERLELP
jgi:isopenicillin-N N-acyltransferase-like protein